MQKAIPLKPLQDIRKSSEASDFNLYQGRNGAPIVVTQPGDGVLFFRDDGSFVQIPALDNTVSFLQGLSFSVTIVALDPSNSVSPLDTSKLTFEWRKNGSPLYKLNNLNNGKGTNTLSISGADSTPDVTGEYIVNVTNEVGVTATTPLTINVYDRLNVPKLYKNIMANGNAELGLNNWEVTGPATVYEYDSGLDVTGNFASILASPRANLRDGSWVNPIEEFYFRFSKSSNWANFNYFWQSWINGQLNQNITNSWINWYYVNRRPNLVTNEYPEDPFGNFYPSKRYIDDYNENYTKFGLVQENETSNTYFSREPIKYNDGTTAALTQTIELEGLEDFADGRVTGTSNLIGHFFAYAGIGINSYTYRLMFDPVYKIGPKNDQLFASIANQLAVIRNNAQQIRAYSQDYPTSEIGISQKAQLSELIAYRVSRFNTNPFRQITTLRAVGDLQLMPVDDWTNPLQKELYINSGPFRELFHAIFLSNELGPITPRIGYFATQADTDEELQQTLNAIRTSVSQRLSDTEDRINTLIIQPTIDAIQARLLRNGENNDELVAYIVRTLIATEALYSNSFSSYKNINIDPATHYGLTGVLLSDLTGSASPLANETLIDYNSNDTQITETEKAYIETKQSSDPEVRRGYKLAQQYEIQTESNFSANYNLTMLGLQFHLYETVFEGELGRVGINTPAPPDIYLDTLIVDGNVTTNFRDLSSGKVITRRDVSAVSRIELIPRCNDLVDFSFRFIGQFGDVLATDTLEGPTVDDLMAVKERMFYNMALAAWFDKTLDYSGEASLNEFDTEQTFIVPIMYGERQIGFLDKKREEKPVDQRWLEENYPAEFQTKLKNLDFFPDAGAAAFFAVTKKLRIPLGTRSIEVKVNMTHSSRAYDQNLVTAGEDSYQLEEIPVNHLTGLPKFYRSGNPRVGVANMKLCLYDGDYKRSGRYSTYFMPPYNVWSERLKQLRSIPNFSEFQYVNITRQYLNNVRSNDERRNRPNTVSRTR
jgi:hypothetical protein